MSGEPRTKSLKYEYKEDQWSPLNPQGKKQYDRSFLICLQNDPLSLQKPSNLPAMEIVKVCSSVNTLFVGNSISVFRHSSVGYVHNGTFHCLALERRIQEAIIYAYPESVFGSSDFHGKKLQNFPGEKVISCTTYIRYLALDHLEGGSMSTYSLQPLKGTVLRDTVDFENVDEN